MDDERSTLDLYLSYVYSLVLGLLTLMFGRFLPKLHVPHKNMHGKTVIVTGGNSGIGFELAKQLAKMHADVYLACRSHERGHEAMRALNDDDEKAGAHLLPLDNGSLDSVRAFAEEWASTGKKIHVLIHNAGIASHPGGQAYTKDGFDTMYQTNFLSSFLLTRLLEPYLARNARVIFTTSTGQFSGSVWPGSFSTARITNTLERGFHLPLLSYGQSESDFYAQTKMMQVALARLLHERWNRSYAAVASMSATGKVAAAFTPGYTTSEIFNKASANKSTDILWRLLILAQRVATPVDQGASTGVYLATADDLTTAAYWERLVPRTSRADLLSEKTLKRLWLRWSADAGVDP